MDDLLEVDDSFPDSQFKINRYQFLFLQRYTGKFFFIKQGLIVNTVDVC